MSKLGSKISDFRQRWRTEVSTDTTMSTKEIWSFGIADFGKSSSANIITAYIRIYMLTVIGVSPDLLATFLTVETVFNYAKGPLISLLEDSTKTKWGRFLPYFIFGAPTMAITSILFFSNPFDAISNETGTMIWVYVCYLIYNVAAGFTDTAYAGLLKCITRDDKEKQKMFSICKGMSIFSTTASSFMPILIEYAPQFGISLKLVFMSMTILCSGLGFFAALMAKNLRERIIIEKRESPFKNIGMVFKNKNVAIRQIDQITGMINYQLNIITPFVFMYCYDAYSLQSIVWGVAGIAAWVGLFLSGKIMQKLSSKGILYIANLLTALSYGVLLIFGYGTGWFYIILLILVKMIAASFEYVGGVALNMFETDIWDHYEWKYHVRNESTTGLVWSWVGIPIALANPIIYKWLFNMIEFQSGVEGQQIPQSDFTKRWLFYLWAVGGLVAALMSCIPYLLIKLDKEQMKMIRSDLEQRRLSLLETEIGGGTGEIVYDDTIEEIPVDDDCKDD